jgi:tRNA U55 pseudouridine synthase TruB
MEQSDPVKQLGVAANIAAHRAAADPVVRQIAADLEQVHGFARELHDMEREAHQEFEIEPSDRAELAKLDADLRQFEVIGSEATSVSPETNSQSSSP